MTIRKLPGAMWLGLVLIVVSTLAHLWLEIDRGMRLDPERSQGSVLVAHTYEVIATALALDRAMQDAERGQRGYLITANPAYLDAYRNGAGNAPSILARLKQLTADNPEQQKRWLELEQQVGVKLAELKRSLEVLHREGFDAAKQVVLTDVGLNAMRSIESLIDAGIAQEHGLLTEQLTRAQDYQRQELQAAFIGGILSLVVLALGVALVLLAFRNTLASEQAQRASDERFRLFVRHVTEYAIYTLDPNGIVTDWNAGAERIKGYTADEIIGQHFSRFYTEQDRKAGVPERDLQQAIENGKHEVDAWRQRKDGTLFMARLLVETLRDASGRIIGFAKVTHDIDERTRQQEALAHYQKMDALGQLTGGIAHDFNNLIHVIKNASTLLEKRVQTKGPEERKYFDMLQRNADRASSLTQRLLAFSRQQPLDPQPIDATALLADISVLIRQALGEGIAVETVTGAGIWPMLADAGQLETAVLNLAVNSRDAMPGGGKLTIEVSNAFLDESYAAQHPDLKPGQYVMIAVSDNGIGMSAEIAAKAFDPFFTTKEVGAGTGLGLSQVYGFIKQSGGHAKIYSEPGEGTTVKLYLPRFVGAAIKPIQPKAESAPAGAGTDTILVVEDDNDVRQFTAEVLGELGYRVLTAGDAAAALRVLDRNTNIDLLFTDIGLPGGVNGRALANEALRRIPALKVLFTTGYTQNAIIHHGRLDPGVELIVKPFTQSSLAKKIRQTLDKNTRGI